jgi:chorismate mutase-like protein
MSEKLEEIRKKIDSLDDRIHDLLMERADLILSVSEEKKKTDTQIVQPAREARMIRRLLSRHREPLPEATIVRIWRELVGSVSLLQTGLKVSVAQPADSNSVFWDMAKNYFGSVLPMQAASSALTAVSALREDDVSFAVIPWPHDGEEHPWWPFLLEQERNPMRIVCALPYGDHASYSASTDQRALVLSKIEFLDSGEDHSFLLVEVNYEVSRTRIIDALKSLKLEPLSLYTKSGAANRAESLHLVEVKGFVGANDKRLQDLINKFEGHPARCIVAGGYPVPPRFRLKTPDIASRSSSEQRIPKKPAGKNV